MYCEENRNTSAKLVSAENVQMHNYRALINYRLFLITCYSSRHGPKKPPNIEQLFFWH